MMKRQRVMPLAARRGPPFSPAHSVVMGWLLLLRHVVIDMPPGRALPALSLARSLPTTELLLNGDNIMITCPDPTGVGPPAGLSRLLLLTLPCSGGCPRAARGGKGSCRWSEVVTTKWQQHNSDQDERTVSTRSASPQGGPHATLSLLCPYLVGS